MEKENKNKKYAIRTAGDASLYISTPPEITKLVNDYKQLMQKYDFGEVNPLEMLEKDVLLPLTVFQLGLKRIEAITVYLVDIKGFTPEDVSLSLNKDKAVIKQAYETAKFKLNAQNTQLNERELEENNKHEIYVPLMIFKQRKLSMLESLVKYLKESYDLKYVQIGDILKLNQRTIWTLYNRSNKKIDSED